LDGELLKPIPSPQPCGNERDWLAFGQKIQYTESAEQAAKKEAWIERRSTYALDVYLLKMPTS
jgi:hypothetical protein